ncbi:hypothetical protein AVEN_159910-1 [Araneus ventricosus]|uniref:Uncharacterized protein n=1 Tax=Araneus ventricosus TaxID=182803 RepID=A0A4Y2E279_ARAVE|nr:hypothetical protein AVEN_159910-1 [Araneus ventricosus]
MLGDFKIALLLSHTCFTFRISPRLVKCTRLYEVLFSPLDQPLMKNMKKFGGLTHGCGVSDSALARWTQEMAALNYICDGIEKFCDVDLTSSGQHLKINELKSSAR